MKFKKYLTLAFAFVGLICSFNVFAGMVGVYIPGASGGVVTTNVNRVYAGLKFTLDSNISKPEAVVGLRNATINSSGNTSGGDLSISAKFMDGFELGKLRAKFFSGQENLQGEIGGGFDFIKGFFAGISAKAPYSTFGADYLFHSAEKFEPYVQGDTVYIKKPAPAGTTTGVCKYDPSGNVVPGPCAPG